MQSGSLTIGGTNANYGGNFYTGGAWTGSNTAGLLLECLTRTEIAVHDQGNRVASLMYYEGDTINRATIGRDVGWGTVSSVIINGNLGVGINPTTKLTIKSTYNNEDSGLCIDASDGNVKTLSICCYGGSSWF
jgi:hypothetical protein